ncbi:MAG: 50S ribosomal protein L24 [Flavobacteriales bacterium]|nr:50S ribosomal protein L24 [Flavobacteriales bacterium]
MAKFHIKKDDTVKVIAGESKGEEGKVLEVYPDKNKALVEGVNMVKRHTKPNAAYPNGGIVEKEAPIHLSNLMLVDPKTGETTRVGRKEVDGKLVRISKKTGEVIK